MWINITNALVGGNSKLKSQKFATDYTEPGPAAQYHIVVFYHITALS